MGSSLWTCGSGGEVITSLVLGPIWHRQARESVLLCQYSAKALAQRACGLGVPVNRKTTGLKVTSRPYGVKTVFILCTNKVL